MVLHMQIDQNQIDLKRPLEESWSENFLTGKLVAFNPECNLPTISSSKRTKSATIDRILMMNPRVETAFSSEHMSNRKSTKVKLVSGLRFAEDVTQICF